MGEGKSNGSPVIWDYIAVYPRDSSWERDLLKPADSGRPVVDVADRAEKSIDRLLSARAIGEQNGEQLKPWR